MDKKSTDKEDAGLKFQQEELASHLRKHPVPFNQWVICNVIHDDQTTQQVW